MVLRHIIRKICTERGSGSCFIIPSENMKVVQASVTMVEIVPQSIKPALRKGINSSIGADKIWLKTTPMVPIIIPMLKVSQKGPSTERRYLCRISCQPSMAIRGKHFAPAITSASPIVMFELFFKEFIGKFSCAK